MKLTEKEKRNLIKTAIFNLGAYMEADERGPFESCRDMYECAFYLMEEIYDDDNYEWLNGIPFPTKESYAEEKEMIDELLTFIESNAEVRNWLLDVIKENRIESLIEEGYELCHYEFFETEEEKQKALELIEKRIEELNAEAETMKETWDSFKKFKYGDKNFEWFL